MRKALIAQVLSCAVSLACFAAMGDLWVDANSTVATPSGTEAAPYTTIQDAIDNAPDNATIWVRPGVYDSGVKTDPSSFNSRVVIRKALTIRSTGSCWDTVIEGKHGTGGSGLGDDAVRCVYCSPVACRVIGFTIRNGGTSAVDEDKTRTRGGGVVCPGSDSNGNDYSNLPLFSDCVIENCAAKRGGGASGGSFVRCLFMGNSGSNSGGGARGSYALNCVFLKQGKSSSFFHGTAVNCTFANGTSGAIQGSPKLYNCLFVNSARFSEQWNDATRAYNCVMDKANDGSVANYMETKPDSFSGCQIEAGGSLVSSVVTDFRPVSPLQAATPAGSIANLSSIPDTFPAEFRTTDFAGNPMPTSGSIYAGAVQGALATAPTGRTITFSRPAKGTLFMDGKALIAEGAVSNAAPTVVFTGTPHGGYGFVYVAFGANGERFYPYFDGKVTLTLPPVDQRVRAYFAKPVWADANALSDEGADGTAAAPYKTLQAAVNAASSGTLFVLAKSGDYNAGTANGCDLKNRLVINSECYVRSESGPSSTFISGEYDQNSDDGCGDDAVRCIAFPSKVFGCVQGFTLRKGRTKTVSVNNDKANRGGAVVTGYASVSHTNVQHVVDCVITDCTGYKGSISVYGSFKRCRFTGNRLVCRVLMFESSWLFGCAFDSNSSGTGNYYGTPFGGWQFNCTVASNDFDTAFTKSGTTYNSIAYGTRGADSAADAKLYNSLYKSGGAPSGNGNVCGFPCFVDYQGGDYRLADTSPAFGMGATNVLFSENLSEYSVGAYPYCDLTGIDGVSLMREDGTLTVGAYGSSVVCEPATLYVDGTNGSDSNDGTSWNSAKATIQAAVDLVTGGADTAGLCPRIMVAPGTYATGSTLSGKPDNVEPTLQARVCCTADVEIVSRDGAASTVILGASDTSAEADTLGNGPAAVRCVYMTDGLLKGFTLRGGRTNREGASATVNNQGGGIYGGDANGGVRIEDCVFDGCAAPRGGAGFGGDYINCRFLGSCITFSGVHLRYARRVYQCYFSGGSGEIALAGCADVCGCTIVHPVKCAMQNCLSISGTAFKGGSIQTVNSYVMRFDRCAFSEDVTFVSINGGTAVTNDCLVGQLEIDSDGRPVLGANVGIDRIDAATLPVGFPSNDLDGGQRVYNGKMDIGCLECDWRPVYSADIDARRFSATNASPCVVHGEGGVFLPAGGTLEGTWTWNGINNMAMNVSVTGGGTLTVCRNGETVAALTSGDGPVALKTASVSASDTWSFAYTATGDAEGTGAWIGHADAISGMTIIVR